MKPESAMDALADAARAATCAPSIFNTQPWLWVVRRDVLRLYGDPSRQATSVDPYGRMLMISCGAALDHAYVALRAMSHEALIERLPADADCDLLAEVRVGRQQAPSREDLRSYRSILARQSDRRPFRPGERVPEAMLAALSAAASGRGARLHVVRPGQVELFAALVSHAAAVEEVDPGYRAELSEWTHRRPGDLDGVPLETVAPNVARRVPVRDFALAGGAGLAPVPGDDSAAAYLVVTTENDTREDWLRAGEALGAVLLTATALDLAASVMSAVAEAPSARVRLSELLDGRPQVALRVGVASPGELAPFTPRRPFDEVVRVEPDQR